MGPVSLQLADAFGLVIQCKDTAGDCGLLAQTVHTLQQALQLGKPLCSSSWEFSTQDYQQVNKHAPLPCFLIKIHFHIYTGTLSCN